ncbi:hypothetical protein T492DRAFT_503876 [Pavlovales sp. CCMP2436]|nr:hypothetical protein T492DRAFT_503876 [Pavlovales sp. CCMP2436]
MPQIILDVEEKELGISAGLQDRVIQWYGGLVAMDFAPATPRESAYTRLPVELLPPLYLAYNTRLLGDSGKVHSPVRARFAAGDPEVVQGMATLAALANLAVTALHAGDYGALCDAMDENFNLRRRIYFDKVVGARNLEMISLARTHGLAAKFTGSGGACICLKRPTTESPGTFPLKADEEAGLRAAFAVLGFTFVRITPDSTGAEGGEAALVLPEARELRGAVLQID